MNTIEMNLLLEFVRACTMCRVCETFSVSGDITNIVGKEASGEMNIEEVNS